MRVLLAVALVLCGPAGCATVREYFPLPPCVQAAEEDRVCAELLEVPERRRWSTLREGCPADAVCYLDADNDALLDELEAWRDFGARVQGRCPPAPPAVGPH